MKNQSIDNTPMVEFPISFIDLVARAVAIKLRQGRRPVQQSGELVSPSAATKQTPTADARQSEDSSSQ